MKIRRRPKSSCILQCLEYSHAYTHIECHLRGESDERRWKKCRKTAQMMTPLAFYCSDGMKEQKKGECGDGGGNNDINPIKCGQSWRWTLVIRRIFWLADWLFGFAKVLCSLCRPSNSFSFVSFRFVFFKYPIAEGLSERRNIIQYHVPCGNATAAGCGWVTRIRLRASEMTTKTAIR